MTHEEALAQLCRGQLSPTEYLRLCNLKKWPPKWQSLPGAKDKNDTDAR